MTNTTTEIASNLTMMFMMMVAPTTIISNSTIFNELSKQQLQEMNKSIVKSGLKGTNKITNSRGIRVHR